MEKANTIIIEKPSRKMQGFLKKLRDRKVAQLEKLRSADSFDCSVSLA